MIDQDGNGELDRFEFRALLKQLDLPYSDDRFKQLYRALDTDGDGTIREEEFCQLLYPQTVAEKLRQKFKSTDENENDGDNDSTGSGDKNDADADENPAIENTGSKSSASSGEQKNESNSSDLKISAIEDDVEGEDNN